MVTTVLTDKDVWKSLESIKDPEIPTLSILDLKIVRAVRVKDEGVSVEITPTFVGCPALDLISDAIRENLLTTGFKSVEVTRSYAVQWSTDMLDADARNRLELSGIAPPSLSSDISIDIPTICPFCKSTDTHLENPFGATLCKQLYYCNSCKQSFEKFKAL